MKKFILCAVKSLIFFVPFISSICVANAVLIDEMDKKVIFVELDRNEINARKQISLFKNMDLVGINFNAYRAEVYVTEDELKFLRKNNLSIIEKTQDTLQAKIGLKDYLNPTEVREKLVEVNNQFPQITNLFEIGKTHLKLPIMAIEISSSVGDSDRPVVFFNATHHAREVMSAEVVMHMIKVLTEQYGVDAEITNWLDSYRIVIVPQANPDGNTLVHEGKTMWRKNAWPYLGRKTGVDLNRNYPASWNYCNGSSAIPISQTYRGPSAGSEPETQAIMNLIKQIKPVASISYHSYSEMVLYPYGCSNFANPSKDLFLKVAKSIKAGVLDDRNQPNTYRVGTAPELLYDADGSDDDWLWKEYGVLAFTLEVNASSFQPNYKTWRNITVERQEGGWKNLLRQMQKSGFHGAIKADNLDQITYSIKKANSGKWVAFDADNVNRKFQLKSKSGLIYQLTEPGNYQISFYREQELVKTLSIKVDGLNIDLGSILLE